MFIYSFRKHFQTLVPGLSEEQQKVFNKITRTLTKDLLRMYIGGESGTGKSYLIEPLKNWVQSRHGKRAAVATPALTSACAIGAVTIYRLFRLEVPYDNNFQEPKYKQLQDQELELLQEEFKDVELIIIDDISLISNTLLAHIHLRLCQIFNTPETKWFGGQNILLLGDLLLCNKQGPHRLFNKLESQELVDVNLWELFDYDELVVNQKHGDYAALLSRIRLGKFPREDRLVLESRSTSSSEMENQEEGADTCLFGTQEQCNKFSEGIAGNYIVSQRVLKAKDKLVCTVPDAINIDRHILNDYLGLEELIVVHNWCKVLLTKTTDGIKAGSIGRVLHTYPLNMQEPADTINIEFQNYQCIMLQQTTSSYEISPGITYERSQFPIKLATSLTFHDSLGLTINKLGIIRSLTSYSDNIYAALSRVKKADDLLLVDFSINKIYVNQDVVKEYNRLRRKYRPDLPDLEHAGIIKADWFCARTLTGFLKSEHSYNAIVFKIADQ